MAGAGLAFALLPRYPAAALGVVFFLSTLSIVDIDLAVGKMRLEQPGILALLIGIAWHRRILGLASLRPVRVPIIAALIYLVVSALSSALIPPDPALSLRLVLWTGLSMLGGLAAYWLTADRRGEAGAWFAASGVFMSVVGLAAAVAFYINGPGTLGIMGEMSVNPKVQALAFEANLYASLLCAAAFFAIERFRQDRSLVWALATVTILAGIGVGITRGAYIGLAVGGVLYAFFLWRRAGFGGALRVALLTAIVATAGGMVIGAVLMDASVRDNHLVAVGEPEPTHGQPDDLATLDYRLRRVGPALDDFRSSPLIGTGLASLDQIHPLPHDELNYINILALSALHDSGVIGTLGLALFFGALLWRLWRSSRDPARTGPAAAYIGALVTLLISYQATNAIHFALNWLIAGAALGLTVGDASVAKENSLDS